MLSNQHFNRTRRLASTLAGIELGERHRELLHRRSRRLGIRDDAGLDSSLTAAEEGVSSATHTLLGLLTTKFTGFFRHPQHFEIAAPHALRAVGQRGMKTSTSRLGSAPHALRAVGQRGRALLWSAGTATGKEAWSLAMASLEAFQSDDPPISILATDVAADALATARRAEYGRVALQTLSPTRRVRKEFADGDQSRHNHRTTKRMAR